MMDWRGWGYDLFLQMNFYKSDNIKNTYFHSIIFRMGCICLKQYKYFHLYRIFSIDGPRNVYFEYSSSSQTEIQLNEGESVRCIASANPVPTLTWSCNGGAYTAISKSK